MRCFKGGRGSKRGLGSWEVKGAREVMIGLGIREIRGAWK